MTDNEKIQHLETKNIQLMAKNNALEAILEKAYKGMLLFDKHNHMLIDLVNRADKIITSNLELLEKTPKQLRVNFLLGILVGILILQTLQDLIK